MNSSKLKKLVPYILLLVLPFIFFYKSIDGNNIILAGDLSGSDLIDLHLPFRYALHQALLNKELPLWIEGSAMGFPLLAEGQTGVFYPPNLALSILSPSISINLSIIFVFFLTGFSTFYLFRVMRKTKEASIFAAITFSFSSFFITQFKHLNMVNVASLFPLLLTTTILYFERKEIKFALLSGVLISLMFFAGHPQITLYSLIVVLSYVIFHFAYKFKRKNFWNKTKETLPFITLLIFVGLGIGAIQILPTLEFLSQTRRVDNLLFISTFNFKLSNLISLISPLAYGNPAIGTYKDIVGRGVFWENTIYLGIIPLLLAIFSLLIIFKNKLKTGDKYEYFFLLLGTVSLVVMLGQGTPLIFLGSVLIPFFAKFRFPQRFDLFFILSLTYLASIGFEFIFKKISYKCKGIFTLVVIFSVTANLFWFASTQMGYIPKKVLDKKPDALNTLKIDTNDYIYSTTQYLTNTYFQSGWKNNSDKIAAEKESIPPNNNLIYNLDSFTDRGWFEDGLSLERRNDFENYYLLGASKTQNISASVIGMYGVKYYITYLENPGDGFTKIYEKDLPAIKENLSVYENKSSVGRTYFVPNAISIDNKDKFFKVISDKNFNPRETVVLENSPAKTKEENQEDLKTFYDKNKVQIDSSVDQEIKISANIKDSGYLVLNDVYYPGWHLEVNGKETSILEANYFVRAFYLDKGNYKIRFFYKPEPFQYGALISFATILLSLIIYLKTKKRVKD